MPSKLRFSAYTLVEGNVGHVSICSRHICCTCYIVPHSHFDNCQPNRQYDFYDNRKWCNTDENKLRQLHNSCFLEIFPVEHQRHTCQQLVCRKTLSMKCTLVIQSSFCQQLQQLSRLFFLGYYCSTFIHQRESFRPSHTVVAAHIKICILTTLTTTQ